MVSVFVRFFYWIFSSIEKPKRANYLHLLGLSACCHRRMTNSNCALLSNDSMCHSAVDMLEIHFRCTVSMIGMHVSFWIHFTWQNYLHTILFQFTNTLDFNSVYCTLTHIHSVCKRFKIEAMNWLPSVSIWKLTFTTNCFISISQKFGCNYANIRFRKITVSHLIAWISRMKHTRHIMLAKKI